MSGLQNITIFILYFIFACAGMVYIKLGSAQNALFTIPGLDLKISLLSILGFVFYGLSFLLYAALLTKYDLSFLNPITIGIVSILIFICAIIIFGESISFAKIIGLSLILMGVFIVNLFR
jgi:drug/metabolite transporter (DMT)-like permease